jgi:hypothetical protein
MKRLADNYPQVVSCVFVPSRRIAPRTQRARLAMPRRIGCGMDPTIPPPAFRSRAGSYALNGWMYGGGFAQDNRPSDRNAIVKEGDIQSSSQTPVLAEGTWVDVWPQEKETPARNLLDGGTVLTMSVLTIARLGAVPKRLTRPSRQAPNCRAPSTFRSAYPPAFLTMAPRFRCVGMTTGTIEGDTFTMDNEGMVFAYGK